MAGLWQKKDNESKMRYIIIDNHQGIGDIVHMLPLIENIRASYSKAYVTMIIKFAGECKLIAPGLIDEFIIWKEINIKEIQRLRARHYDLAYLNVITNYYKGILYLKFVIGADKVVSEFWFSKISKHYLFIKRKSCLHRVTRNNRLSKVSSLKRRYEKPDLCGALFAVYNNNFIEDARSNFKSCKIIGICMGSATTEAKKGLRRIQKNVKQWPVENIHALCTKLAEHNYDVVILGGTEQKYISNVNISNNIKEYIHDYIDKCSLAESMQLISLCNICVGVDTGLMHMAAALDVPTITLFGPTDPKEFAPYSCKNVNITLNFPCQYCYGKPTMYDCQSNECMKKISVEEVFKKIMERLGD